MTIKSLMGQVLGLGLMLLALTNVGHAQGKLVTGKVTNSKDGSPVANATVVVKGTGKGTNTDANGNFSINVPENSTLVVSSVGFGRKEMSASAIGNGIGLTETQGNLNEVVITGYGTARKKDLTGAVATVTAKDFVRGPITTPEQLIAGKVAGVQVSSESGQPGVGSRIRIRGGTSLNASNDPLIVIDGVPVENSTIAGGAGPLSMVNPNDIESFNILKDASAAAIYGSRAANGVIIITTKKGRKSDNLHVSFSTLNSISSKTGNVDVLSAKQFTDIVNARGNSSEKALLGTSNTNWQDQIYHNAFATDNNIAFTGGIKALPYRLSLGYLNQDGILKRSHLDRYTTALNLSPKFFTDHLSVNANLKYSYSNNFFADQGAIGSAVAFDPTQPVHSGKNEYGGYWEWINASGLNGLAPKNPVGLLNQREDKSKVSRFIGNIQLDYKFHFLPELRADLNAGIDNSHGEGTIFVPAEAASAFSRGGGANKYQQDKNSKLLEFYLNYTKDLKDIRSRLEVMGGYSYQDWKTKSPAYPDYKADGTTIYRPAGLPFETQNTLVSFFGRVNYALMDRYLLTANFRRDGSSRFSENNRWGNFPSLALAWKIIDEDFMKNQQLFSNLKLRLGWGITGQQDGIGDYNYQPAFFYGDNAARYQFGNQFVNVARPQGYDANLRWEQTTSRNFGLDMGFLQNKLNLSIDYYEKDTKDLLAVVPAPAGTNFTNQLLTNVGSIKNRGLEFTVNTTAINTGDFYLDLGFNVTWIIQNDITKLQLVNDPSYLGAETGSTGFNNVQIHSVGYRPSTFFLYQQVYSSKGVPIEGLYVDRNKDGVINSLDKYWVKNPDPTVYLGFSANGGYKNFGFGFTTRAHIGNYMYNAVKSGQGIYQQIFTGQGNLNNAPTDVLATNFNSRQTWSDYYLENASFFRMDNIYVNYNFGKVLKDKATLRVSLNLNNAFTITKYTGLDPEINGGIDGTIFPRPRTIALGLNLDF
jgi:TonB-linked SusC/RagA family outer membrane protein